MAFTMSVTQLCACFVLNGGWSESWNRGVTHVTGGRAFASMSRMQVVDRPDVLVPHLLVVEDVLDRGVGLPDVAGLVGVGRVGGPVDVATATAAARPCRSRSTWGACRSCRRPCSHVDEDVLAVGVAAPALEDPAVVRGAWSGCSRGCRSRSRLAGDEVQVVGVRRARRPRRRSCRPARTAPPTRSSSGCPRPANCEYAKSVRTVPGREPVHLAVVVREVPGGPCRAAGRPAATRDSGSAGPPGRTARPSCVPFAPGEPSEQVVEAAVLQHQVDDALDRPPRVELRRRRSAERRPRGRRGGHAIPEARGQEEPRRGGRGSGHELTTGQTGGEHGRSSVRSRSGAGSSGTRP